MKTILLDENLPKQLKPLFSSDFNVLTVQQLGWHSKKNGELLTSMTAEGIDILLTADRNLQFQQNLEKYPIQIVVLFTYNNRLKALKPTVPFIESEIRKMKDDDKIFTVDVRPMMD